jgi:hypothetical protein
MKKEKTKIQEQGKRFTLTAASVLSLAILAACGGGGGSGSSSASAPAPATPAMPTSLGGTVAMGNALAGANVTLIDSSGRSATATSDSSGSYSISISGLTAPFLIVATDPSGNSVPLYSVTASVPTGSSAPLVANVTPLTTAVAAELTSDGNPLDLSVPKTLAAQVTPAAVSNAVSTLNTILSPILSANNVQASSFNPISTTFSPNQTGPDAVIDSVAVTTGASGGLQLASVSAPSAAVALNSGTSGGTQLAAPAVAANYLAPLLSQLSQCLSGTSAACSSAVDAKYLENGYNSANGGFAAYHANLGASGSTITGAKTLVYWPARQSPLPNITNPSALVRIFYTDAAGQKDFALTVVQQTANGWDIIGNQQAYNVSVSSFVLQRQFLDPVNANASRNETGLNISIPVNSASPVNPANLGSANVTGPGLPAAGVWLEPRSAVGSDTLSLTSHALTGAPANSATSNANTTLFRWSWQALPANSGSFSFAPAIGNALYSQAQQTAQTLPAPFATYTMTFYDTTGKQIGSQMKVVNSTPPFLANAATGVAWQTLGNDVASNFLSPSGSQAAAQATVNIDWSGLVNGQNIAPLVTGVQIQTGSDTSSSTPAEVDGWWKGVPNGQNGRYAETVTAGVAQNGQQTCTAACSFPALGTGVFRLAELAWGTAGVSYYNISSYNN